jgi:hypothetical protein
MFKTSLRKVPLAVASGVLVCAAGACGTDLTTGAAFPDLFNLLLPPVDSTGTQATTQADQSDSGAGQDPAAAEAGRLLQDLEAVLGAQNAGTVGAGASALLTALASVAGSSPNSATSQPATPAHPLRQLRAEIHTLRHSLTREQAAQLLLSALAASRTTDGSATTGTGSSGSDLLAPIQNLLATLRAMDTQPTTP